MSIIYHNNGNVAYYSQDYWNSDKRGSAFHSNGNVAYYSQDYWNADSRGNAYHSNGNVAYYSQDYWNADKRGSAFHNNGNVAYYSQDYWSADKRGNAYHSNGQYAGSGIEVELGSGIRMMVGSDGFKLYVLGNCVASESKDAPANFSEQPPSKVSERPTSNCFWCDDKYYDEDGVYQYLRKGNKYRRYDYCSNNCANKHEASDDFVWVNDNGLTKSEQAEEINRINERRLEIQRAKEKAEAEKQNEDTDFFRKYGMIMLFVICSITGYSMFKEATPDNVTGRAILLISFLGLYVFYSFFPSLFSSKQDQDKAKKYNIKPKPIPVFLKFLNLFLPFSFTVAVLFIVVLVKTNGNVNFLYNNFDLKVEESASIKSDTDYEIEAKIADWEKEYDQMEKEIEKAFEAIEKDIVKDYKTIKNDLNQDEEKSEQEIEKSSNSRLDKKNGKEFFTIQDADGYSNLRKSPGGEIIRKVYENETFQILVTKNKHVKVIFDDGSTGYIHETRVVKVD
jgi:hypothetical protein